MCRLQPVILAVRCARVALPYSRERRAGEGGAARRDVRTEARWHSSNLNHYTYYTMFLGALSSGAQSTGHRV